MITSLCSRGGPGQRLALGSVGLISLVGLVAPANDGLVPQRILPPAAAAPPQQTVPPLLWPGEAYGKAQQRLLAKGWRPQPRARQSSCSILQADRRCALFPELVACASTGSGFCRFQWHSPQGQSWALITVGGNPQGDPGSITTWFVIR
ncbi:MAG: hypothetical protein NT158_09200 [Cyanobacteria bacterium]|nr:hypothetical protein [Cyanobacteriota bacterium]